MEAGFEFEKEVYFNYKNWYCSPRNIRANQDNCAFFAKKIDGIVSVHQFDIKGNKDRVFEMSFRHYFDNFETLSKIN